MTIVQAALRRSVAMSCEGLMEPGLQSMVAPLDLGSVQAVQIGIQSHGSQSLCNEVKHLDSAYEPSTKRSDCWLKLKKVPELNGQQP